VKVLGISGSLRSDSHNTRLLRVAAEHLAPGVELEVWDGLAAVPPYDEDADAEPAPAAVQELRDALREADAVLFATPEYNGSVPGQLKNALDWASRPFTTNPLRGKPRRWSAPARACSAPVWAQAELRKVLTTIGARVLEDELAVPTADDAFDGDGRLADGEQERALAQVVAGLHGHAAELAAA
jgi:chromate reductase